MDARPTGRRPGVRLPRRLRAAATDILRCSAAAQTAETPDLEDDDSLCARFNGLSLDTLAGLQPAAPEWFMYAPGGIHTVYGERAGVPTKVVLKIGPETADTLNKVLKARLALGEKPMFDFNHEGGAASGHPQEFAWRETPRPGVFCRNAWSNQGNDAVVGRAFTSFSPEIIPTTYNTSEKNPAGIKTAPLIMGGLVNDPAFKKIAPLMGRNSKLMQKTLEELQAELDAANSELTGLKARPAAAAAAAATLTAREARIAELENVIQLRNTALADTTIAAAVSRGILLAQPARASKEEAIKLRWHKRIVEEGEDAAEMLNAIPGATEHLTQSLTTSRAEDGSIVPFRGSVPLSSVLRGMKPEVLTCSAEVARERGLIYNRALKPYFKDENGGWNEVLKLANTLGTLSGIIVTQRALELLKFEFPELSRITTDFSAEPVQFNQQVTTRTRAVPGVTSYDPVAGYSDSNVTDTDVDITISQHRAVQIVYTANDLASTKRLLFPEQEEGMHFALGNDLVTNLYALITPANFPGQAANAANALTPLAVPGTTVAGLDQFARPTVIAMKTALNLRGVTGGTRTLLLSSLYHAQLEADTTIVGNLINVDSGRAIGTSVLPPIARFQPFEAPNLPTTGNLQGFGFRADALAIAARLPNDYSTVFPGVTGGGVVQIVTNPDTGLSVMLVMFLDHKLGQTRMRVALMYGTAVGQGASGQLLVSQ